MEYIYHKYNVQVSELLPSHLNNFYLGTIPQINTHLYINFDGITEVYKHTNSNDTLYYYNMNSLHPYASLNDMPGRDYTFAAWESLMARKFTKDLDLFGFFYCNIKKILST